LKEKSDTYGEFIPIYTLILILILMLTLIVFNIYSVVASHPVGWHIAADLVLLPVPLEGQLKCGNLHREEKKERRKRWRRGEGGTGGGKGE
jgi:uncharacterized integral membrane protein